MAAFCRVNYVINPADRWHTALVGKMSLDIPGVRPSFRTEKPHEQQVRLIVRFRERLYSLYAEDLNPRKTVEIKKTVEAFFSEFPGLHARFTETLKGVADAL